MTVRVDLRHAATLEVVLNDEPNLSHYSDKHDSTGRPGTRKPRGTHGQAARVGCLAKGASVAFGPRGARQRGRRRLTVGSWADTRTLSAGASTTRPGSGPRPPPRSTGTPSRRRILDDSNPPFYRWYPGGTLNTCHNAVDRHVDNGHGDQPALIYDSPVTGTKSALTFAELRDETARFAGVLAALGITKGDRVVIYMPMIPEAVIAMLACARLGAVHSVVFGGFAAHELAVRIDDAKPRLIVSASCGIEVARVVQYKPILDAAVDEAAHKPEHTIIVQRPQATRDHARDGPGLARPHGARPRRPPPASPWTPPTRSISSTPPAPPGSPRAWSGTTAATRSRSPGRCATSTTRTRAKCSGPPPTSAGSSATRTSSTRRSWPAAPRSSTRASRSAPRRRRLLARHRRAQGQDAVHRPDGVPRDPQGGPERQAQGAARPLRLQVPVPGGRAPRPGHLPLGRRAAGRPGHRPLVADRDGLGDRRQPGRP